MESLAETRQRGQPSTEELQAGTRPSSWVSRATISLCHTSEEHKDKLPSVAILGTGTCFPRLPLSCWNGPPYTRAHVSSLCDITQAGQSPQILLLYVKAKKLNIQLLRVICLPASQFQLSYQTNSLQGSTGTSTASLSISSALTSNTGTKKPNRYGIKTLLFPTIIKVVNFLV